MLKDEFRRELKNDLENQILIDISQRLAYHENELEDIRSEITPDDEGIYQNDMGQLALYISNKYINEHGINNDLNKEFKERGHYFYDNYKQLSYQYFSNELPPIEFKETTARSNHALMIQEIYKQSVLGDEQMQQLIEKEPDIEIEVYSKISGNMYDDSCNSWCDAIQKFTDKASEYGILSNVTPIKQVLNHNPMVKENIG